ncbi:DNA polymerase III subunit delta' [Varunaivibrio sulfuroxidans]|uniref:DNA polymerase III delta prime subunit n=1 Tax=Varunaivibrio sulfuroxidans TaxID=1773489 RepID=A0A4R3JE84_9PROT|nr:DNA polymerase III subunit delta' [Varunaivibrio sulfuroxidans]TCS64368.1 DNA polymerase III delta prime subunit [Varunaivibrio sulfuroxidans]WES31199.1 DNA polymerase III subunit delta' [Varunaivibrio sulfuroxidans]
MSKPPGPQEGDAAPDHPRYAGTLIGHDAPEAALLEAYNTKRLHHAWLFCGPRGIGKATLAYRFARFLLVHGGEQGGKQKSAAAQGGTEGLFAPTPPSPPGAPTAHASKHNSLSVPDDDPIGRRVKAGGHGDLLTIERRRDERSGKLKSEIVVDDVRAISHFMALTTSEGGWRVAIIDSADDMNTASANAVLKILEEPPNNSLLILISHNPGRLLPTIRSRCRKVGLSPLKEDQVRDLLCARRPDVTPEGADALAHLAEGSIGRALDLFDEGGLDLFDEVATLMSSLAASAGRGRIDGKAVQRLGDQVSRAGNVDAFRTVSEMIQWWLSRIVLCAGGKPPEAGNLERNETILRISCAAPLDRWLEVWEKINRLIARTDGAHLDRKQVLIDIFLLVEGVVLAA